MAESAKGENIPSIAHQETPHSPSPALSERAPNTVPGNPHEQGDTANIYQNTTNRRTGS